MLPVVLLIMTITNNDTDLVTVEFADMPACTVAEGRVQGVDTLAIVYAVCLERGTDTETP
jgi:hypothetical protein